MTQLGSSFNSEAKAFMRFQYRVAVSAPASSIASRFRLSGASCAASLASRDLRFRSALLQSVQQPGPSSQKAQRGPHAADELLSVLQRRRKNGRRATGFQRSRALTMRLHSFPKTISSTRRQYASITFGFSEDTLLVTCISGPNSESVAVRLTII
jgi:hypothetical protein